MITALQKSESGPNFINDRSELEADVQEECVKIGPVDSVKVMKLNVEINCILIIFLLEFMGLPQVIW